MARSGLVTALQFGRRATAAGRALVMTSVDLAPLRTPDVRCRSSAHAALSALDRVVADGADIVEIGVRWPGPPAEPIEADQRATLLISVLTAARRRHPDLVLGIDTDQPEVGRLACAAGADLVCGGGASAHHPLAEIAAEFGTGFICTHHGSFALDVDPVAAAERAVAGGVAAAGVVVELGWDFLGESGPGPDPVGALDALVATGWPVSIQLPGADIVRDSDNAEASDLNDRAVAAAAVAAWHGVRIVRTRDVRRIRQVVDMVASIAGTRSPSYVLRALV